MPVDKMKQSTYLCDIVHVKHKGLPIFSVLTRFLIQGRVNAKFKFKYPVSSFCLQCNDLMLYKK